MTLQIWLFSPSGVLLHPNLPVSEVDWTLEENTFGVLTARGPLGGVDPAIFTMDCRLEIHRAIGAEPQFVEGNTQFVARAVNLYQTGRGQSEWTVEAYTPEYWLDGRIINSWASTPTVPNALTTKSGPAANVIKAFVRENGGPSTSVARRKIGELAVDPDDGGGYSIVKSAAHKNLLKTIQDIAADSAANGVYLSFGITKTGATGSGWTFHTWVNQRGTDHSTTGHNEIILSREIGNLKDAQVYLDGRDSATAIVAGGRGEGAQRDIAEIYDPATEAADTLAVREDFLDLTNAESADALDHAATAEWYTRRVKRGFRGKFVDTRYAHYGNQLGFGDLVTAQAFHQSFTCRLSKVHGQWSARGGLRLDIDLTGEA